MTFVSLAFLIFIAITFILYFLTPPKFKWIVLLVSSSIFYAINSVESLAYIVITSLSVFLCGRLIAKNYEKQEAALDGQDKDWLRANKKATIAQYNKSRKTIMLTALLLNFGILGFVKYFDFLATTINEVIQSTLHIQDVLPRFDLLLPLGISFYTFQALGYILDVYRGKYKAEKNYAKFALFISFFPQIVQGPIGRYDHLAHQLYTPHKFDYREFKFGLQLLLWGLFKKLVVADRAAVFIEAVIPNYEKHGGTIVGFAVLMFVLQVYADFSGGMDIARGVAQCMGIKLELNFTRPNFAVSISDYWQRWHRTLGSWMRDYLLYSVALSKPFNKLNKWSRKKMGNYFGKLFPTCLAMTIVFFVVGIWHGPGWKNIAFGFYNGFWIVLGILLATPILNFRKKHSSIDVDKPFWRILAVLKTFIIVYIGKFFAAAPDFTVAIKMMQKTFFDPTLPTRTAMFKNTGFTAREMFVVFAGVVVMFFVGLYQERKGENNLSEGVLREAIAKKNIVIRWSLYFAIIFAILLFSAGAGANGGFVYEQF